MKKIGLFHPPSPLLNTMSWSADGRHLLYSAGPAGEAHIYRLDLASHSAVALITSQGDDVEPDVFGSFQDN